MLHAASASRDAGLMNELSGVAEKAVQLLSVLDTTTAAALAIDTELPRLKIDADAVSAVIGLAIVRARIERLQHRAERTLAYLEGQRGPERCESLRWLSGNYAISITMRPVSLSPAAQASKTVMKAYHNLPLGGLY